MFLKSFLVTTPTQIHQFRFAKMAKKLENAKVYTNKVLNLKPNVSKYQFKDENSFLFFSFWSISTSKGIFFCLFILKKYLKRFSRLILFEKFRGKFQKNCETVKVSSSKSFWPWSNQKRLHRCQVSAKFFKSKDFLNLWMNFYNFN